MDARNLCKVKTRETKIVMVISSNKQHKRTGLPYIYLGCNHSGRFGGQGMDLTIAGSIDTIIKAILQSLR